ncbi:hypothetical protein EJ110_NYTH56771 [Nymphaea thermarum]|nr:hypothetical protein EJ110_NYTH56771 [Nymphaea thermarum]
MSSPIRTEHPKVLTCVNHVSFAFSFYHLKTAGGDESVWILCEPGAVISCKYLMPPLASGMPADDYHTYFEGEQVFPWDPPNPMEHPSTPKSFGQAATRFPLPDWGFRSLHPPSRRRQGGQACVAARGFPMRVACWNVRGLNVRYRRRYLSSWVRQHGPSVLIIVETKMSVISHAYVRTLMRQPTFGFVPANRAAGGILLAWSPPLTGVVVHVGRYSISASLIGLWPNGPVLVTAVYGPCVGALREQLWAELHQVRQLAASPWLLARDFNCLLSPTDSSSPIASGPSMSAFRSFVD